MKAITKKQQYINGLEHDIEWCNEVGKTGQNFAWFHGELKSSQWWMRYRLELISELEKANTDKTFKPWKDENLF